MKKHLILCMLVFFAAIGTNIGHSVAREREITISDTILIPESVAVRTKMPDGSIQEITSSRLLLPGVEIAPDNTASFTLLCPDFTTISSSSEGRLQCPEIPSDKTPDVILVADSGQDASWTYWPTEPVPPDKEPLEYDERYKTGIAVLEKQLKTTQDNGLKGMLCHLYAKSGHADNTTMCYLEQISQLSNSDDTRRKALVFYEYALHLWKTNQKPGSIEWAYEALKLYQQTGDYRGEFQQSEQGFLKLSQRTQDVEVQAFARHHLALLYWFYQSIATEQANKAFELYEQIGHPKIGEQLQEVLDLSP